MIPQVVAAIASGPVALVFGPERTGLTNEEISRCHFLIHIPTDPVYPAINLAQAVAICLYEVRRAWFASGPTASPADAPAPFADVERMFAHLGSGDPTSARELELNVIAAVVIGGASLAGGQGTVVGAMLGVMILALLQNGVRQFDVPVEVRYVLIGVIIVVNTALSRWQRRETA